MKTTEEILQAMYIAAGPMTEGDYSEKDICKVKRRWKKLLKEIGPQETIILLGNRHYLVNSRSRPGEYHAVDLQDGELRCVCEDATLNLNKNCFHVCKIREVEQHV